MAAKKSPEGQAFGVFTKNGQRVVAESVDDAVRYRFDGWTEEAPAAPENLPDAEPTDQ